MRDKRIKRFVTGQQLGLLGGPLYTTYKVLGAVDHATKKKGEAIYWLETNDADFNEINHIEYIDSKNDLKILKWDIDSKGFACGKIVIDEGLVSLLNIFFNTIIPTEHTSRLRDIALGCYKPGRTLGDASVCLAGELFGDFDIEFFDPSRREFLDFSRPILLKEAENTPEGEQCNLFWMDGKRRRAVFKKKGEYVTRENEIIDIERSDFVPSLKTRSICQDAYFSTTAYIAGPGEEKYLKELGSNYKFHGVAPPDVIPRMSIDLIEPVVARGLKKLELKMSDIENTDANEMIRNKIKDLTGFDKSEIFKITGRLTDDFIKGLEELGLTTRNLKKSLFSDVKGLVGQRRKSDMEKSEKVIKQVRLVYKHLRPFDKKQERVFNLFYYMNLFGGKGLIKQLYKRYDESLKILEIKNG